MMAIRISLFLSLVAVCVGLDDGCVSKKHIREILGPILAKQKGLTIKLTLDDMEKLIILKLGGCPGSNTGGAIYFSAAVTDSRTTSKRDQVLLFPNVITNEGGAFSAGNGTFTCPQDGAYHFSYGYLTRQTQPKAVYVALRVNGQVKAWAYTQGTSFHESAAKSIVLPLKKGDYVQCVAQEKGTTLNAGPYTTFSGFKIQ